MGIKIKTRSKVANFRKYSKKDMIEFKQLLKELNKLKRIRRILFTMRRKQATRKG